jgi:AraC-like DNA-binding protein
MQGNCRPMSAPSVTRPIGLLRVAGLVPFVAHLARTGPVYPLLAHAGVPERLLDSPDALMPASQAFGFMDDAAAARGVADVGLRAGVETPIDALATFGRLIAASKTLGGALDTLVHRAPDFDSSCRWWIAPDGPRAWLCRGLPAGTPSSYRQAERYWLGIALALFRAAAGPGWRSDEACVQASEPHWPCPSAPVAGTRIAFDRTETAMCFPTQLRSQPLPCRPHGPTLDRRALDHWYATAPAAEFLESIGQVIATLASFDSSRIDAVARAIGTGVRTLQRRLAAAGVSYETMLARARLGTAARLLASTDATVLDIALDVGYSDHAHFTRAFRRWTGVPPREFRKNASGTARLAMSSRLG